jgi:hypothetical protein
MAGSPLTSASPLAPNVSQLQYPANFLAADANVSAQFGGSIPQAQRYQYWQAIGGDALMKVDPRAAALAYDTAITVGVDAAKNLVRESGGDAAKMYQARNEYAKQMAAKDPSRAPMLEAWSQHNTGLGQQLNLVPKPPAPAPTASQTPGQPQTQAQATPTNRDAMINNIMRTIRGGESGGKYGITSFAEGKGSTASGGYQFADATWQEQARKLGGEATKYKRAKDAPREIQDAVAKNYVSDILRRNGDQPAEVFKEWYGGPKKYLTQHELEVNRGLTMDRYLARRMANYNKIAGGQAGPETIALGQSGPETGASGQTPLQTGDGGAPDKPAEPEKSAFERAADAVSSGITGAAEEKKPQAAPAIPTTKPTVPVPTGPIAPSQRDMYAKALDAISKRNASNPPTQPAKPADAQEKAAPTASTPEPTPEKEAATPNDEQT